MNVSAAVIVSSVGLPNLILVVAAIAFLVAVAAVGITCALNPKWGIKRFSRGLTAGGELRRDWNELSMSLGGLALAAGAIYILYAILWK